MLLSGDDLRKAQLLQLKILKEVHRMCEKHNIKYFLSDGTLIGAVRHQGFIPWDDDLDIGMLREEYKKFCTVCKTELSNDYFFQTLETDPGYARSFGRMMLRGTIFFEEYGEKVKKESCLFIDIFPYDCIPNEFSKQYIQCKLVFIFNRAYCIKKGYESRWSYILTEFRESFLFLFLIDFPVIVLSFLPFSVIHCLSYYFMTRYSWLARDNECSVTKFGGSYFKNRTKIKNLRVLTLTVFEDDVFYIPKNYHDILSGLYGDYMSLPPMKKRLPSHEVIKYQI